MAKIIGIDHVQLAMPLGAEGEARTFFGHVMGLAEIPKPPALAVRGGVWFDCGPGQQLHLGGEADFRPARKAHPALLVDDLAGYLAELASRGFAADYDEPLADARRATIADPFGNRIELIERLG
ncbi:glyoxalase [Janthinobacterium sp. BJB412]|nr:glyoxalase [Janthinobacterium sp. BJB412]